MMESAIADIAVVMIDYQVPVPEQYGSKMMGPWSSCSDFQVTKDDFKKHILKDSAFLEALMKAMRIKVIPFEIQRQLELQQARIDTHEPGNKRKEQNAEDTAESTHGEAKKMKVTPMRVNNNPDNEGASDEGEDFHDSKMSDDDDDSTISVVSEFRRNTEKKHGEENQEDKLQSPVAEVLACEEKSYKDAVGSEEQYNEKSVYSESSDHHVMASAHRKKEMKKYVVGNCRPLAGDDTSGKKAKRVLEEAARRLKGTEGSSKIVNQHYQTYLDRACNDSPDTTLYSTAQPATGMIKERKTWLQHYYALKAFREDHGHCKVPYTYHPNQQLSNWVRNMREHGKKYLDGNPTKGFNADRWRMLNAIGFIWYPNVPWEEFLPLLQSYKQKHGHCNVPKNCEENQKLGVMAHSIRQQGELLRKGIKSDSITRDREKMLEEIGFNWKTRAAAGREMTNKE